MTNRSQPIFVVALIAACLALCVVVLGAYVRLSDAGLGCPDWPGCYGRLVAPTAPTAVADANQAFPNRPVQSPKAWKEMIHRYAASTLGLLILGVAFMSLRRRRQDPEQPLRLPLFLVGLVVLQGMLGMWTVTLLLKPLIVTMHLLGGMTTLLLLWWFTLRLKWRDFAGAAAPAGQELRLFVVLALTVVYCQIALGGWTSSNYAAIACGASFPSCNGQWWPAMDFKDGFTVWRGLGINYEYGVLDAPARTAIHMTHRLGALLTFLVVGALAVRCLATGLRGLQKAGLVLALALVFQVSLGIANVRLGLPLPVAVAHNAGAAVLLLSLATVLHLLMPAQARQ